MLLWSITIDDIIAGLRERGLRDDLTRRELNLIVQSTDAALDEAAAELLGVLAVQMRQQRESQEDQYDGPEKRS